MVKLPYNASPENSSRPANRTLSSPVSRQITTERNFLLQRGIASASMTERSMKMTQADPAADAARTSLGTMHGTAGLRSAVHPPVVTSDQTDSTARPVRSPASPLLERSGGDDRSLRPLT